MTAGAIVKLLEAMRAAAPKRADPVFVGLGLAPDGRCLELSWRAVCPCDREEVLTTVVVVDATLADLHAAGGLDFLAFEIERAGAAMAVEWTWHETPGLACYVCKTRDDRPVTMASLPPPARGLVHVHVDCKGKLR